MVYLSISTFTRFILEWSYILKASLFYSSRELVASKGAFADFLLEYMADDPDAADDEELAEIKHELEDAMGEDNFKKEFARQASRYGNRNP